MVMPSGAPSCYNGCSPCLPGCTYCSDKKFPAEIYLNVQNLVDYECEIDSDCDTVPDTTITTFNASALNGIHTFLPIFHNGEYAEGYDIEAMGDVFDPDSPDCYTVYEASLGDANVDIFLASADCEGGVRSDADEGNWLRECSTRIRLYFFKQITTGDYIVSIVTLIELESEEILEVTIGGFSFNVEDFPFFCDHEEEYVIEADYAEDPTLWTDLHFFSSAFYSLTDTQDVTTVFYEEHNTFINGFCHNPTSTATPVSWTITGSAARLIEI